jgi:hypothetical protein
VLTQVAFGEQPGQERRDPSIVTLCVHAGIAAADVLCFAKLGVHHDGDNHDQAIALVAKVDKVAAKNLKLLLAMNGPPKPFDYMAFALRLR